MDVYRVSILTRSIASLRFLEENMKRNNILYVIIKYPTGRYALFREAFIIDSKKMNDGSLEEVLKKCGGEIIVRLGLPI